MLSIHFQYLQKNLKLKVIMDKKGFINFILDAKVAKKYHKN